MIGIHCQLIVCILAMFKNKINNYLVSRSASKARIHLIGLPI